MPSVLRASVQTSSPAASMITSCCPSHVAPLGAVRPAGQFPLVDGVRRRVSAVGIARERPDLVTKRVHDNELLPVPRGPMRGGDASWQFPLVDGVRRRVSAVGIARERPDLVIASSTVYDNELLPVPRGAVRGGEATGQFPLVDGVRRRVRAVGIARERPDLVGQSCL